LLPNFLKNENKHLITIGGKKRRKEGVNEKQTQTVTNSYGYPRTNFWTNKYRYY